MLAPREQAERAVGKYKNTGLDSLSFWELAAINDYPDLRDDDTIARQAVMFQQMERERRVAK
jgi:hypothetical protein